MKKLLSTISVLCLAMPLFAASPTFNTFSNQFFTVDLAHNRIIPTGVFPGGGVFSNDITTLGNLDVSGGATVDGTLLASIVNAGQFFGQQFSGDGSLLTGLTNKTSVGHNPSSSLAGSFLVLSNGQSMVWTIDLIWTNRNGINSLESLGQASQLSMGSIIATNYLGMSATNSSDPYLVSGAFKTVGAFGLVFANMTFTNNQISWLTNQTTHLAIVLGSTTGLSTNYRTASFLVNSNDSICVTNVVGGSTGAALNSVVFQGIH